MRRRRSSAGVPPWSKLTNVWRIWLSCPVCAANRSASPCTPRITCAEASGAAASATRQRRLRATGACPAQGSRRRTAAARRARRARSRRPSRGRSRASVSSAEISSTTSMPSVTRPNTVCLPSSQDAASVVTMKNWLPFVFGPGVRHRERAAHDLVVVELVLERVARAAGAGARRVAALDHEVGDDAVEDDAVVEAVARELREVLDRLRRVVVEELDRDRAVIRVQRCGAHVSAAYRRAARSRRR